MDVVPSVDPAPSLHHMVDPSCRKLYPCREARALGARGVTTRFHRTTTHMWKTGGDDAPTRTRMSGSCFCWHCWANGPRGPRGPTGLGQSMGRRGLASGFPPGEFVCVCVCVQLTSHVNRVVSRCARPRRPFLFECRRLSRGCSSVLGTAHDVVDCGDASEARCIRKCECD